MKLVSKPSDFEGEMATEKAKKTQITRYLSNPSKLFVAGSRTNRSKIHKLTNYTSIEEEVPEECRESIIVPIYKKDDKTECSKYRGISLLSTTYKILSNILLQKLTPYAQDIIVDHQCRFRRSRSTTDQIFCIRQVFEKKW